MKPPFLISLRVFSTMYQPTWTTGNNNLHLVGIVVFSPKPLNVPDYFEITWKTSSWHVLAEFTTFQLKQFSVQNTKAMILV